MAILYKKNTLYICKHEEVLKLRNQTRLKHTLHTSLLRGMNKVYIPSAFIIKVLFFINRIFVHLPVLLWLCCQNQSGLPAAIARVVILRQSKVCGLNYLRLKL